jgi:hypothetical protein
VLEWDLAAATNTENTFTSLFSFEWNSANLLTILIS